MTPYRPQVVDAFERLYHGLLRPEHKGWLRKQRIAPKGIYIYGSVGRGKTHLMDLFYDSLPDHVGKDRQHYHEFMLWLHAQLRTLKQQKDPLVTVVKRMAKQTQVLCLDEFLVNDIANAMLLAGMLEAFSQHGVALVTTSNVQPDNLYRDGLQRAKFLPAIAWIKQHMQVMHLDGAQDYRQQATDQHEHWYFPINDSSRYHLTDCYDHMATGHTETTDLVLNGRALPVIKQSERLIWCDFKNLCEAPRSASDYIALSQLCDVLIIQNIPRLDRFKEDAARRLITLIDVLYENEIKLIAQAECHYKMIYQGQKLQFEFQRAASRLAEMLV